MTGDRRAVVSHEMSESCWCRPRVEDQGLTMIVVHRDLDPSTVVSRKFHGGEDLGTTGDGAPWRHFLPGGAEWA